MTRMHNQRQRTAHDALETWRRLDRWLSQLSEDDPSRGRFQRRIDEARDEYLERIEVVRHRHERA